MLLSVLPTWLREKVFEQFNEKLISEIRLRLNQPILVEYKGEVYSLKENRANMSNIIADSGLMNNILEVATKQSLYAYIDQIRNGYITTDAGERIGLCGTVVYNEDKVSTIKNITSINIRIPHQVEKCSKNIINFILSNQIIKNTLIISPPGAGKTTMIRDIAFELSQSDIKNILVIDERFELFGVCERQCDLKFKNIDILSGSNKSYGFNVGIKTLSPSVIITDEISKKQDIEMLCEAKNSGVSIIATMHAKNIQELKCKAGVKELIENKIFERIVVLSKRNGAGTIEGVFDENLRCLYLPYMP